MIQLRLNKNQMIRRMKRSLPANLTKGLYKFKTSDVRDMYEAFAEAEAKAIIRTLIREKDKNGKL